MAFAGLTMMMMAMPLRLSGSSLPALPLLLLPAQRLLFPPLVLGILAGAVTCSGLSLLIPPLQLLFLPLPSHVLPLPDACV